MKGMKRWKWNYLIDAGLFLCMMALAGIGLLMKYIVIPGRDARLKYGEQVDLQFLGLDRHQWGSTHFIISLVLLGLLSLHIILHWSMIVAFFRRYVPGQRSRYIIGYAFLITSIVLLGFPLLARPELVRSTPLRQSAREERLAAAASSHDTTLTPAGVQPAFEDTSGEGHSRTLEIRGYMTLRDISRLYGLPESSLLEGLGITDRGAARERLGQLRSKYDFTMEDVEEIIMAYRKAHPPPITPDSR